MKLTHKVTVFKRFIYLLTTVLLLATGFVLHAQDSIFPYPYRHTLIAERQFVPSFKDYESSRNEDTYAYNANCFRMSYQYLISFANYQKRNTGISLGAGLLYREGQMHRSNGGFGGYRAVSGPFTLSRWFSGLMCYTEWQQLANLKLGTGFELGGLLHTSGNFKEFTRYALYPNSPYTPWITSESEVDERSYFRKFYLDFYTDIGFRIKLNKTIFLLPGCKGYLELRDLNEGARRLNFSGSFYLGVAF